ncbi:MAG: carboxypeptidase regulatory-like domain-containing protein [Chloroflexota bacterium]
MKKLFLPILIILSFALAACGGGTPTLEDVTDVAQDGLDAAQDGLDAAQDALEDSTDEEEPTSEPEPEPTEVPVEEPAAEPADITGNWEGDVVEGGSTYLATISIDSLSVGSTGTSNYPSFPCGGSVTLTEIRGSDYIFEEKIETGSGCVDGGLITAALNDEGLLDWTWAPPGSESATATGTLAKVEASSAMDEAASEMRYTIGEEVTGNLDSGSSVTWTFTGTAGQAVNISIVNDEAIDEIDTAIEILQVDPAVSLTGQVDALFDGEDVTNLAIPADGDYQIVIMNIDSFAGDYVLTSSLVGAEEATIEEPITGMQGMVVDIASSAPLAGAQVCVQGTVQCASVGDNGSYSLSELATGDLVFEVSLADYDTAVQTITLASGETLTQDFALAASSPVLAVLPDEVVLRGVIFNFPGSKRTIAVNDTFEFLIINSQLSFPNYNIGLGDSILYSGINFDEIEILVPKRSETTVGIAANAELEGKIYSVTAVGDVNESLALDDQMEVVLSDPASSSPPYTVNFYRGEGEARTLVSSFTIEKQP